jgi:hypothetical protein
MQGANLMREPDINEKIILKCKFKKQHVRRYAYRQRGIAMGGGGGVQVKWLPPPAESKRQQNGRQNKHFKQRYLKAVYYYQLTHFRNTDTLYFI